jgi:hypothetical protein
MHQPTYTFPPNSNDKVKILVNGKPIAERFYTSYHINFVGDNVPQIIENKELNSFDIILPSPTKCECSCTCHKSKLKDK